MIKPTKTVPWGGYGTWLPKLKIRIINATKKTISANTIQSIILHNEYNSTSKKSYLFKTYDITTNYEYFTKDPTRTSVYDEAFAKKEVFPSIWRRPCSIELQNAQVCDATSDDKICCRWQPNPSICIFQTFFQALHRNHLLMIL